MSTTEEGASLSGKLRVVPLRHYGRWASAVVIVVVMAMAVHTIFSKIPTGAAAVCHTVAGHRACQLPTEWRFHWDIVRQYFLSSLVLHGLALTLEITLYAMVIGIVGGVLLAVLRRSPNRLLSSAAWTYTWFFRATPVYVQLLFWFIFSLFFPHLTIGLPFVTWGTIAHINTVTLFSAFVAATLGFGLNEAAYFSEIVRAGMNAVDEGQIEAATSLGMSRGLTLRKVILPQAMRIIVPPTGNEIISMLKLTSIAASIGVLELTGQVQNISAVNYQVPGMLMVASLWYLIATTVLSTGQFYVERYFNRGVLRTPPPTPWQRIVADVKAIVARMAPGRGVTR